MEQKWDDLNLINSRVLLEIQNSAPKLLEQRRMYEGMREKYDSLIEELTTTNTEKMELDRLLRQELETSDLYKSMNDRLSAVSFVLLFRYSLNIACCYCDLSCL